MKRVLAGLLSVGSVAACGQPDWRDPQSSQGSREVGAPAAAAAAAAVPTVAAPAPQMPAWAQPLMGKLIRQQAPAIGRCQGNTEFVVARYTGVPAGVRVNGWGWDLDGKRRLDRIVAVDVDSRIVGAGEGGLPRADVPLVHKGFSPDTGWEVVAHRAAGPLDFYGLVAGGAESCLVGHLEF